MHKINGLLYEMEYHALSKCYLKLVCAVAIGDAPIHDVATREKRLLGSEHAFCAFLSSF